MVNKDLGRKTTTVPTMRKTMLNKDLLDILACPKCKGPVVLTKNEDALMCEACRVMYEIRDNIPVMLIDEAKKIND